jgi:hypothetical protein
MIRSGFFVSMALALFSVVGCGGDEGDKKGGSGDGDSSGDGDISLGDGDAGTGDGDGGIDGCLPVFAGECSGITYEGENVPLDIYVMFDLSCSMSCTVDETGCCLNEEERDEWRIQPVREAMRLFLNDPRSAGIGVGLGFFGDHDVNTPDDPNVCTVEAHSDAAVPIGLLPAAAADLTDTLDTSEPQGGTPTHLGIQGACQYSNDWKSQNPGHKVVILLVTDGIPEHSCDADIRQAVDAAEECYDSGAGREIYVLGIEASTGGGNNGGGSSLSQLNDIAEAGGTEQAYLTDANDVAGSVLTALNAIRADAVIPCTLNIPEPSVGEINYQQVNVGICDASGQTVSTYFVSDEASCDNGAWYYEQVGGEQVVQLCEQTCDTVTVAGASLSLSVGCDTVVTPVR